jgi:hypothetical protein
MMVITSYAEGWGWVHFGKWQGQVAHIKYFTMNEAIIAQALQLLVTCAIVIVNSMILRRTGSTFHTRHTFSESFTTISYGLTPLLLLRSFDAIRGVPSWLPWIVGLFLCFAILYHGVPLVMKPDPAHAFGLYMTTVILLLFTTGLLELGKSAYLTGNFSKLDHFITALASKPPS